MNFTIIVDTGNIEQDVWTTINNFQPEQMKQFIEAIKLKRDDSNITGISIFFRYPDCQKLLSSINDVTKVPIQIRKLIREKTYRLDTETILMGLSNIENVKNQLIRQIINKIHKQIDIRKIFSEALSNEKYNSNFYNLCFEIISSDEYFNKFLNYNENKELFGTNFNQQDYVFEISKILGYQEKDINQSNSVYKYHFITLNMLNRYIELRKKINVDLKMLGDEIFNQNERTSYSKELQQKIDNDWSAHPKLIEYIMNDMDPQYNILEQIIHIYIKLCLALRYNLGYHIQGWGTTYNKNRQESITPTNNEIICSEFSILATNIINKLSEDIEARCIITGKDQHLSFGILHQKKNIRINFDSTKLVDDFDDLGRVKLGLPLNGIIYICDRNNEFKTAFEKVYDKFCKQNKIETKDLIKAYEIISTQQDIPIEIDFYESISEFIEQMKTKNVVGSELLGVFKLLVKNGYFGNIKYSIVGEDKKLTFSERKKLSTPQELLDGLEENIIIQNQEDYYLLRLNDCYIIPMSIDELNILFDSDKMAYFNPKHRIEGIGVKSCTK